MFSSALGEIGDQFKLNYAKQKSPRLSHPNRIIPGVFRMQVEDGAEGLAVAIVAREGLLGGVDVDLAGAGLGLDLHDDVVADAVDLEVVPLIVEDRAVAEDVALLGAEVDGGAHEAVWNGRACSFCSVHGFNSLYQRYSRSALNN